MKMSNRNIPSWPAAVVLPLAYLLYWLLRMSALSLAADLVLWGGAIAAIVLAVLAFRQGRSAPRIAASFIVGLILCGAVLLGIGLSVAWPESYPGVISYTVSVTGLEYYRGGLITTILVPFPTDGDTLLIPESSLTGRTFGEWNTTIVETKDGRMLAFQSRRDNLTDIDARFDRWESQGEERSGAERLSPVLEEGASGYTTVVYIDEGLVHVRARPITFDLELTTGGGLSHGMAKRQYATTASITVPADTIGRIPVNASVERLA
ncbi:MAG: hypothetical protein PWP08_888 [Methanofollis sp.]|nr:hypothetical protein [Methanofollis sp.]